MMKIVASLVIFGLCANVCFGAAPASTSNSGAFSTSVLNSSATSVLKGSNTTDATTDLWDSSCATCGTSNAAVDAGVYASKTWFGPGATNDTSYLYGVPSSGYTSATASTAVNSKNVNPTITTTSAIRKRTINNTIVGWQNDTSEASVVSDTSITVSIMGSGPATVAPGYLVWLTTGFDSSTAATTNSQVWITLLSGTAGSATTTKLTSTADTFAASATATVPCTYTTYTPGNVWYDIGSGAIFYTYSKTVVTAGTGTTGSCGSFTTPASTVNTIYLGGIYLSGTAYWTSPISVAPVTASASVGSLIGGGDNWLNATNIYLIYKDSTTSTIYSSKTTKSNATTAIASFSALIKDSTSGTTVATSTTGGTDYAMTYTPVSVWSSNFTYGITVQNATATTVWSGTSGALTPVTTTAYTYTNFLNGSSTGVDSGVSSTGATGAGYTGWQLNTGYSILSSYYSATSPYPVTYTLSNFYANGTGNGTSMTLGSLSYSSAQFYEDVNGTMWIGWTDVDTAQSSYYTYSAYLAKLQGQLNVPSGANVLSALSVFALFLVSIFAF